MFINKLKEYAHSINLMSMNWGTPNKDGNFDREPPDNEKKKQIVVYKKSYKKLDEWYNSKSAEDIKNITFPTLKEKGKHYGSFIAGGKSDKPLITTG